MDLRRSGSRSGGRHRRGGRLDRDRGEQVLIAAKWNRAALRGNLIGL